MKPQLSTILLVIMFLFGLSLILYPSVSNYWNSFHMTTVIHDYQKSLDELDDETYEKVLTAAQEYNSLLAKTQASLSLTEEQRAEYDSQLNLMGTGVMGYIEIPSIDVELPIFHGTSDNALRYGIGHLEGTSLPIGGESSHSVLCGHRGLPTARLFTDLDKLEIGDTFTLYMLDEVYTYEVCDIFIVEPNDGSKLYIEDGQDYCTLFTCTPYGINTQRLLIRGHRIDSTSVHIRIASEAYKIDSILVAPLVAVPILVVLLIYLLISTRKKGGKNREQID